MELGTLMVGAFALFAILVIGFIGLVVWKVTRAPLGEGRGLHQMGADARENQASALDAPTRTDG